MKPTESFVEQPIRSLQTMLRIIAADDSSLPTVIPDGIYGPATLNAVTAFQRKYDLPITGITDQQTWDTIVSVYEPANIRTGKAQPIEILLDAGQILTFGDNNPYIYLAQAMLLQLSEDHPINAPVVTGTIDKETADAIIQFQKLTGLDESGDIDRITWKNLVLFFTQNAHKKSATYGNL